MNVFSILALNISGLFNKINNNEKIFPIIEFILINKNDKTNQRQSI